MLVFENIILAISAIRANRARSLLTMLGIIIGISSVITITSMGNLLTSATTSGFFFLGSMGIKVGIQKREDDTDDPESDPEYVDSDSVELKEEEMFDVEKIRDILNEFSGRLTDYSIEKSAGNAVISERGKETRLSIVGKNNKAMTDKKLKMIAGRAFTEVDQEEARLVCVISDKALKKAFKMTPEEALGQDITLIKDEEFQHFTIVGVYYFNESEAIYSLEGADVTEFYVPVKTAFVIDHQKELYTSVDFSYDDDEKLEPLMKEVQDYVNRRYFHSNSVYMAKTFSNTTFIKEIERIMGMLSAGVAVIAGISLMVGGIGVMNIMLVSIQERTREIGTRKALGATNSLILTQFIAEAIMLCLVGGVIGCLLGIFFGDMATTAYNYFYGNSVIKDGGTFDPIKFQIPYAGVFISLFFSSLVGVFFGFYPAKKAADLNPIDALRYE